MQEDKKLQNFSKAFKFLHKTYLTIKQNACLAKIIYDFNQIIP